MSTDQLRISRNSYESTVKGFGVNKGWFSYHGHGMEKERDIYRSKIVVQILSYMNFLFDFLF